MFLTLGDLRVHYQAAGAGDPLVLVHGTGADAQSWEEMIPSLAARFKVYAYDLRGAGLTERPPEPRLSFDLWTEDLAKFCEALEPRRKVAVAGWSSGAAVALCFALRYPDRVSQLALIGAWSTARPATDRSGFLARQRLADSGASIAEIVDKTFDFTKTAMSPSTTSDPAKLEKIRQMLMRSNPKYYSEWVDANGRRPQLALQDIDVPTLIIAGDADARTPVEMSEDLNKAIPNSFMKIVPQCGHFYCYEQPKAVSRTMLSFLSAFAGGARALPQAGPASSSR